MKRIFSYYKPYVFLIIVVFVLKLAGALADIIIPNFLADIVDKAVPLAQASGDTSPIIRQGVIMIAIAFVGALTNLIANVSSSQLTAKFSRDLRQDLYEKISGLSARQLDGLSVSSAISRLTSDTYNVHHMFTRCLRLGVRAPILMIGGVIVTLFMDKVLAIVMIITLPLVMFLSILITKKAIPLYTRQQEMLDGLVNTVQENAVGVRVIKALCKSDYERRRYDKQNTEFSDQTQHAGFITALTGPVAHFIFYLSLVCVVWIGAIRTDAGLMQAGKIIAFISYFTIILNATISFSNIFVSTSKGAASAERISEVMDMPEDMQIAEILPEETDNAVEFRDVTFSYNGIEPNLKNISFGLKKGQTLGIIGFTGSGKSTISNLLMRLYDPDKGQVLLDGRDVRSIDRQTLCEKFGVTFQNDFLMAATIRENIAFFRDIPDAELKRALTLSQAEEFVTEKGGMDYMLEIQGNNLSGGQKQRLLIARALAAKPEILILDDSSSALDYRTDALLRKALAEFKDTTKIIVAQRVSSIRSADLILMLENGEIIGRGRHEDLMENCPTYREIAEMQMESSGEEVAVNG